MNAASMIQATAPEDLLRKSLRGNAIFSTLCGLVFVFASGPIAGFLGELHPLLVLAVGLQLLLFAGALVWLASKPGISVPLSIGVIVADLLWLLGSIAIVYADLLTRGGAALALVLADVVLLLAILQSLGVHRLVVERG